VPKLRETGACYKPYIPRTNNCNFHLYAPTRENVPNTFSDNFPAMKKDNNFHSTRLQRLAQA
jgi:hypothetical protein